MENNTDKQNINMDVESSEETFQADKQADLEEVNEERTGVSLKKPEGSENSGGSAAGSEDVNESDSALNSDGAAALNQEEQEAEMPEEGKKRSKGMEALTWVRDIVIAIVIALVISQFITPTIVQEHSMDNTLHSGDYLILWKMAYKFDNEPEYGDIVVFKSDLMDQDNHKKLLIKRVIAVGGDTIAISDGVVYRNGEPLDEPYTKDGFTNGGLDETVVPEGELFLMGDNRVSSRDSRDSMIGFVDEDLLIGKAVLRLFPFNKIGSVYGNEDQDK